MKKTFLKYLVSFNAVFAGPLANTDNFFVVASSYLHNLYQIDASSGSVAQLLEFGTALSPKAVAYDPDTQNIYWSDVRLRTISRYSLITNATTIVYRDTANLGKVNLFRSVFTRFFAHHHHAEQSK